VSQESSTNQSLIGGTSAGSKEQETIDVETTASRGEIALQTLEDLETSDGVVVLHRKDALGRMRAAAKYVRVPCINPDVSKLSKRRVETKAKMVQTVLRELGEDSAGTILQETNRRMGYSI
jgi:fructose-specific phosphotransferase system component IIB